MRKSFFIVMLVVLVLCAGNLQALTGDVNDDGQITIVDAILVARYYAGFSPVINTTAADVDQSRSIDIIDALFIAQYNGGLLPASFPVRTPTPTVPVGTVSPPPACTPCVEMTLFGYIYSYTGNPLRNAIVYINRTVSMKTGIDGMYSFTLPGTCTRTAADIWVSAPNTQAARKSIVIGGCGTKQLDFTLALQQETYTNAGDMWLEPVQNPLLRYTGFTTACRINTGTLPVAAYGIHFLYNPAVIQPDYDTDISGFQIGTDGFLVCVNGNTAGDTFAAGFDPLGKGPGAALDFLTISWKALEAGFSPLSIRIVDLTDPDGSKLGIPMGHDSFIEVGRYGDVDTNGKVDIVDALKLAQFYVEPIRFPGFFMAAADVNGDGNLSIVDALMIAQYYVGMITGFPAEL